MTETSQPDVYLLFDVMDTLVFDPVFELLPRLFDESSDKLWELADKESWPAFERGEMNESEYFEKFFTDRRPFPAAEFKAGMNDGYQWLPGIPELLAELTKIKIPMYTASNYPVWYQDIEAKLNLSDFVDWRFVSCKMGVRKPSAEFFKKIVTELNLPAANGLFIDNRLDNVKAAASNGLNAVLFESAEQIRGEISEWLKAKEISSTLDS